MKIVKKIFPTLVLIAIVALLVIALWPAPVSVNAVIAEQGYFEEYVEEEGRTRLPHPFFVTAPIGGYLRRVDLDAGVPIQAGDLLFEIEPLPSPALDARSRRQARENTAAARALMERAQAVLEERGAELRFARLEYERSRRLAEENVITQARLDRARSDLERMESAKEAAEKAVEAARFELRNAEAVLEVAEGERTPGDVAVLEVRSPMGGVVLRRHRWSEGAIQQGERLLDIGDLSQLEVQVDLISMDAVRVAESMPVVITRWGGEENLHGRTLRIDPAGFTRISALGVEEQRVPVIVAIDAPWEDWRSLGEGYRVEARFIIWQGDDVLQVPTGALFRRDGAWAVFVVENGRAALRRIETGRRSGLWTQIISGLQEGEKVIIHPGDRVEEGARVAAEVRSYR